MKIILSSNNKHKIQEVKAILPSAIGYQEVFPKTEIIEDGKTFEENAIKKVEPFPPTNNIYLGDDSGLEVEALGGKPGIYSARYAGGDTSTTALCTKVLAELQNHTNRKAQFRTVIAIRFPDKIVTVEGVVKGIITEEMIGSNGFGYDPIFIPEGYKMTFAQMDSQEKNQISHRKKALAKVQKEVERYLSDKNH